MADAPPIRHYLMDMDGVIVHEERAIPGIERFISRLGEAGHPFCQRWCALYRHESRSHRTFPGRRPAGDRRYRCAHPEGDRCGTAGKPNPLMMRSTLPCAA